jgi:hypothetical protein
MQHSIRRLPLRRDADTDASQIVPVTEPDREASARSRDDRRVRRERMSGRLDVMGNDAGWYRR